MHHITYYMKNLIGNVKKHPLNVRVMIVIRAVCSMKTSCKQLLLSKCFVSENLHGNTVDLYCI